MRRSVVGLAISPLLALTSLAGPLDSWTTRGGGGTTIAASDGMLFVHTFDYMGILSSTNGVVWKPYGGDGAAAALIEGMAYGNGRLVAVGSQDGAGPEIWTSTNSGSSGTFTLLPSYATRSGGLNRVAFGGGTFVAVGGTFPLNEPIVYGDGLTWQGPSGYGAPDLSDVAYGNNQFVVVGGGGTIYTSLDGTNWTQQVSGTASNLAVVACGGGHYVILGNGVTLTSTNGS
ncbi:MAG: hypothetical protein KGS61_15235, partial [Verrucomicrobia bacterium]|nr:hypothetical protein [Verrucomicrobiota bacterium]